MSKGLVLGCMLAGSALLMPHAAKAFSVPDGCSAQTLAGLKSGDSDEAARITFQNMYPRPVEIWWINFEGKPELFLELAKDQSEKIETFVGHIWKVVDTAGKKCVFSYSADKGEETVLIME
jgi:hypothetical protein